jgi:hypothetical protein
MSGLLSVLLFGVFYASVTWRGTPGADPVSPYIIFVALPGVLILSVICALVGAFTSTKWWLIVAAISILSGVLWFGTSSV